MEHKSYTFQADKVYGDYALFNPSGTWYTWDEARSIAKQVVRRQASRTFEALKAQDLFSEIIFFDKPLNPETDDCAVAGWIYDPAGDNEECKIARAYDKIKASRKKIREQKAEAKVDDERRVSS